jgi:hypothetical protein
VQAVDPKLKGQFDIEVSRIWDDGLADSLQRDGWLNREDFDKALSAARARYPEPPRKVAPLVPPAPLAPPASSGPATSAATPEPSASRVMESALAEPSMPVVQGFAMRVQGWPAKFVRPWRARVRR